MVNSKRPSSEIESEEDEWISNQDQMSEMGSLDSEAEFDMDEGADIHELEMDKVQDEEEIQENQPSEKTKSSEDSKKSRVEQKNLLKERKMNKPHAPLIQRTKKIWEELRQKKISKNKKVELMTEMMGLVSGKCQDIIFKHDASRIIQCCLKYGSPSQRDSIAAELKGSYAQLSSSQYGKFIISKILNYCSSNYRADVIKEFYGKVRKLIRHREASIVLEEAYSQFANSSQKFALIQEFYGPEFAIFKNSESKSLQEILKDHPEKKTSIVKHLREAINSILEKGNVSIAQISIIHRILLEYLNLAEESAILDLIENLKDHLVHILHTREGSRVAQICLTYSTPKNRKHIVKTFKSFVPKIAKEQYGHSVLISCFDVIDDTVLLQKAIFSELIKDGTGPTESFLSLLRNKFGSRVILFLLCGRNRKYQPSYLINELEELDSIKSKTSKKEEPLRRSQILEFISGPLLESMVKYSNQLMRDKNGGQVLFEFIKNVQIDKSSLLEQLADLTQGIPILENASDNTTLQEPQNVIKKMKDEADKAFLEESINLKDHLLVNRNATFNLKSILSIKSETTDIKLLLDKIWGNVSENFDYWIKYCISNPLISSGTSFVLLNLFENGNDALKAEFKKKFSGFQSLVKDLNQSIQEGKKFAKSSTLKNKSIKKRKIIQEEGQRKTGIEILIESIQ